MAYICPTVSSRLIKEAYERHLRRIRNIESVADREGVSKREAEALIAKRAAPYRHRTGKTLIGPEDV